MTLLAGGSVYGALSTHEVSAAWVFILPTGATITTEVIPIGTSAKLVGVDASESDSDVLWVVAADGTAFISRAGARL